MGGGGGRGGRVYVSKGKALDRGTKFRAGGGYGRAETRTTSSADVGHVDPSGSTQAGRIYNHKSAEIQWIDQLRPI